MINSNFLIRNSFAIFMLQTFGIWFFQRPSPSGLKKKGLENFSFFL